MKYRNIVPYIVLGATFFMPYRFSMGTPVNKTDKVNIRFTNASKYQTEYALLDKKAAELRDVYVSNSVNGMHNLNQLKKKNSYSTAVRKELPGAPVGSHCLYGQYVQLDRALKSQGDTLTIIPQDARQSCINFKDCMRNQYGTPEYDGCIKEGKMFASSAEYNAALAKYMSRKHINADTPDSVRRAATDDFAKRNFNADELNAGTVLVVPRWHGSNSKFHAILYMGRGKIVDGKFVPDHNGHHIYSGYNREALGDLFTTYDASNVFAADVKKIAMVRYSQELAQIKSMSREDLIQFLEARGDTIPAMNTGVWSRQVLLDAACAKYFNQPLNLEATIAPRIEMVTPMDIAKGIARLESIRTR